MLLKRQCPHTGIVNFFSRAEPHLPVGFIYPSTRNTGFTWRCHTGTNSGAEGAAGRTVDLKTAEANLSSYYVEHTADGPDAQVFSRKH
jgi:hypothetical protein